MISFVGRLGILDPLGVDEAEVVEFFLNRGVDQPSAQVVDLLGQGGGGEFPYVFNEGPAAGRDFSHISTLDEATSVRSELRDDLVSFAIGGGGDLLLVSPTGEIYVDLVDRSGTAARQLHMVAGSFEDFLEALVPAEDVLDDMIEFAHEDGRPDRPSDIANLRECWKAWESQERVE